MKPIDLKLPSGATLTGELLQDYSECPRRLSGDILQIDLPTGETIDVSWRPSFDPNGNFQIVVFRDEWDNQLEQFDCPIAVKTPAEVAKCIERIIETLTHPKGVPLASR